MPNNDRMIRTSHGSISVRDSAGNGLPVVLIHGLSCSKDVFFHQFDGALVRDFRVIAIDLPGHGTSSDAFSPKDTYSVSGYADAVIEVLEFFGIEQAVVVGSSLGGQIALEMQASFSGIIGVMLAGSAPLSRAADGTIAGLRRDGDVALLGQHELDGADLVKLAALLGDGRPELHLATSVARTDGRARTMLMADLVAGDFTVCRNPLETSVAPIAIINGACDQIIDNDHVAGLPADKLWDHSCRMLPNVGHMPFVDVPEIFDHLLKVFARDAQATAAAGETAWGLSLSA